jgi:hypothetical protein
MPNIDAILREINRELVPQFEEKLRARLANQDKDWLIEQIVRLTLDAHSLEQRDREHIREEQARRKQERADRLRKLNLDEAKLDAFIQRYQGYDRGRLTRENLLSKDAPAKGKELISAEFRSAEATELLQLAKDMLFGFLFGDETMNRRLLRTQRQLLTLTIPRTKAHALDFMKSATELRARGTWQDPDSAGQELQTDNVVLEIEYGETEGTKIGEGIITALRLINALEINEELLYGRMEKVEQSTLVS